MKIIFETISFKNILSYGDKLTTFEFQNGIDLVVGSNGNGKSTFVDALTYGLFGKPFRKIKIGGLINNKNNKNLWVEVIFTVDGSKFKIIRGLYPNIFEIYKEEHGEFTMIEKPSTNKDYQILLEENILQFGENVFRQLIALGANLSSSKNFMDLSKTEKEEVLQVITDTAIFNQIKDRVKEKKQVQKTLITEFNYKVAVQSSTISSMKMNISAMEKQNSEFNTNRDTIIVQLQTELNDIQNKISSYPKVFSALDALKDKMDIDYPRISLLNDEIESLENTEQDLKSKTRVLVANEKNKIVCPNCDFEIKEELQYTASELKVQLQSVFSAKTLINDELSILVQTRNDQLSKLQQRNRLESNLRDLEDQLSDTTQKITNTESWEAVDIDYSDLENSRVTFEKIKSQLIEINTHMNDLVELEDMVSDKNLKGVILNQQLPFLNKFINEFLELFGSKFNFVIDSTFTEKIISRSSDNDFNSLSNGQKQRISLSILFAFLKLIEEKNGISTNLLILDEYLDSSLDIDGIDEVMSILDEVFSDKKDVVLISHNPDIKNRLELLNRTIDISMEDGFSKFHPHK